MHNYIYFETLEVGREYIKNQEEEDKRLEQLNLWR